MRPFASRVAVRFARATDMLAVAVQLPVAAWLEPEPEATAGAANAKTAQAADATDLTLTTSPPFLAWLERGEDRQEDLAAVLQGP